MNVAPSTAADEVVPVLIVGGGPAGLTLALELAQRGIDGLLVERRDFSPRYPRAHLLNVRTMETFHDIGVADDVYRLSPPEDQWHRVAWYTSLGGPTDLHGRRIGYVDAWGGGHDLTSYRTASPRPFANLPQIRVDRILWEHADRAWPGRVLGNTELVDLVTEDDGALATVRDVTTGETRTIRARYVVAADGGRTTAKLLGVEAIGPRALLDLINVYFSADLSDHADEEALITYFINPEGQGSFEGALLGLGPDRWGRHCSEWSAVVAFRIGDPNGQDHEQLVERARRMIGVEDLEMEVHSISHWQFEGVVAERFRVGPALIIGDAAHRHPPTGGLGLNTAVGDVANLAWKLEAVLAGYAEDALLDTYELERQPVAARNVEHSLRNAGRHGPVAAALGLGAGLSIEEGWQEIGTWASDTDEGAERRRAAETAIAANAEDYSQLNVEAGFSYEVGAVRPDGTPPPATHDSATEFTQTSRPGHHIPHVWLNQDGRQVSTSDLVARSGFTLFVAADAADIWTEAATVAERESGCPIRVVAVGSGGAYQDPTGEWAAARDIDRSGALLVRPDRHVAWRTATAPTATAEVLSGTVTSLLRGEVEGAPSAILERIEQIAEAGELLRTGGPRDAELFEELATAESLGSRT
ncbi:FAD-dependent monooxygenase [Nocardioides sp. NPDC006273]|uniref:FAD-dependent monooxygenase n=1 Tax=Nocardioides sp. NPDC006273 TaxID=3155598 RepID=UPI0033BED8CC